MHCIILFFSPTHLFCGGSCGRISFMKPILAPILPQPPPAFPSVPRTVKVERQLPQPSFSKAWSWRLSLGLAGKLKDLSETFSASPTGKVMERKRGRRG
jgi:hypothetical protein